jgi:NAD(P)-dependent dehydrogenase (short-subunit alcohol dehydrogenase family)
MVERVLQAYRRLDILVVAAGVGVAAPFRNTTTGEYRQMIDVNFLGPLYAIHAALPVMTRQGGGHIVIISSGTGRYVHPSTVYSGTKHAVSAMAESLRREIGKESWRRQAAALRSVPTWNLKCRSYSGAEVRRCNRYFRKVRDSKVAAHSITSSARPIIVAGSSNPGVLAVFRLRANWNFVGS